MKNGTRNEKVVFDIIFNLICMIYIIYSWMSITNGGVVTALTHNNGDAMLLIFGAAIVLIVFFYNRYHFFNIRQKAKRIFAAGVCRSVYWCEMYRNTIPGFSIYIEA